MSARKPLKVVEPAAAEALTNITSYELPPVKAGVKLVGADNVAELVRLLHEEQKQYSMKKKSVVPNFINNGINCCVALLYIRFLSGR